MAEGPAVESTENGLRELLGDGPLPFPARKSGFQPWHRPRKQYVRRAQWSRELGFLARDLELDQGSELRYLTLPGNDLLDIRYLAKQVCEPYKLRLRYLGFNTAAFPADTGQSELNTAQFSINRLKGMIHEESEVYPGDFRRVGLSKSTEWERVLRAGPFHAINLDLCGGFAGQEKADGIPNYFAALKKLLKRQGSLEQCFLLFITTRMDDDNIDPEYKAKLNEETQKIHDTCADYAFEFANFWEQPKDGKPVNLPEVAGSAGAFMLGLTQWIVYQGVDHDLKASVKSLMTYRTGSKNGEDDIVSLAILFKPVSTIPQDAQGLVKTPEAQPSKEEKVCQQSKCIPKKVYEHDRIDEILRDQTDNFECCLKESLELLSAAGHDTTNYRNWVLQEIDRYKPAQ